MPDIDAYRSAIERVQDVESYESADQVIDAYHKLRDHGHDDLDNLVFEYARFGIENKYVNYVFETHLIVCDYCIDKLTEIKFMLEIIDEYGEEAISIVKAEEFMDEAKAHQEKGNFEEAKKCLEEALELRPGDTEIIGRLLLLPIVAFDDTPQKPKLIGDKIVIPIAKPTEITVEYPGDEVWRYNAPNNEIFSSVRAISALQDRPEQPVIVETDSLIIEIHKGEDAGKLFIRLKK